MKALIWVLRSPLTVNTPPQTHRAAKNIFLSTKNQETRWQSRNRDLFAAIMIKRWSTETALPATQTGYGILIRVCECVTEKHALNWQTMFWIPLFCEICVCGWPVSLFSGEFLPVLLSFIDFIEIYSLLILIKLMRQIVFQMCGIFLQPSCFWEVHIHYLCNDLFLVVCSKSQHVVNKEFLRTSQIPEMYISTWWPDIAWVLGS